MREDPGRDFSGIMDWETDGKGVLRRFGPFYLPVAGAHYGVIMLDAMLSIAGYFVFPAEPPLAYPILASLLILNSVAIIYSCCVGFMAELGR